MNSINSILLAEKKTEKDIARSKQYWEDKLNSHIQKLEKDYRKYVDEEKSEFKKKINREIEKIDEEFSKKIENEIQKIQKINFEKYFDGLKDAVLEEVIEK